MRTLRYSPYPTPEPRPLDAFHGVNRVAACIQVLTHMPAVFSAAAMKLSFRSLLTATLGISKSHIAKGGLSKLKPRMEAKALETARTRAREKALANGWTGADYDAVEAGMPRLSSGEIAPLASWVHGMQSQEHVPLPLTISLAVERDELIEFLRQAAAADDPTAFRDAVLEAIVEEHLDHPENADLDMLRQWELMETWEDVIGPFESLTQVLMFDFIAALDAEWGARYFASIEPQPIFPWVAPRMNPSWHPATAAKQRNLVFRPTRRLLEFSHAIIEHAYLGTWPEGPPGRQAIATDAGIEDYVVGNLFDGTRKLSFDEFQSYWLQMCSQHRFQHKRKGYMFFPSVLALIALGWECTLVKTGRGMKLESSLLLDETDYRGRWRFYRELWQSELGPVENANGELKKWPEWLLQQTLRPPSFG